MSTKLRQIIETIVDRKLRLTELSPDTYQSAIGKSQYRGAKQRSNITKLAIAGINKSNETFSKMWKALDRHIDSNLENIASNFENLNRPVDDAIARIRSHQEFTKIFDLDVELAELIKQFDIEKIKELGKDELFIRSWKLGEYIALPRSWMV